MDNMQRRLEEARTELLDMQQLLVEARTRRWPTEQRVVWFLAALDRAWEAQCMAQGSL